MRIDQLLARAAGLRQEAHEIRACGAMLKRRARRAAWEKAGRLERRAQLLEARAQRRAMAWAESATLPHWGDAAEALELGQSLVSFRDEVAEMAQLLGLLVHGLTLASGERLPITETAAVHGRVARLLARLREPAREVRHEPG